jgi:hypothetical protein
MLLLAVAGAVFNKVRQKYQSRQGRQAPATVADATPFKGHRDGETVTYQSTAPEEAQPHTPLGL